MPIYAIIIPTQVITSDFFTLEIEQNALTTMLVMRLTTPIVNTRELPKTYQVLKENLPTVLQSQCFNEANLPFSTEVRSTEIGHLFEHILLDYLCYFKLDSGCKRASFSGETNWNWKNDPRGTFYIDISAGINEREIFVKALQKTIVLVQTLMHKQTTVSSYPLPANHLVN